MPLIGTTLCIAITHIAELHDATDWNNAVHHNHAHRRAPRCHDATDWNNAVHHNYTHHECHDDAAMMYNYPLTHYKICGLGILKTSKVISCYSI